MWNMFCLKESGCVFPVGEGNGDFFVEEFGDQKVRVDIPESSFDELTGAALDFEQVKQGMKTEVQQLERLKVGRCLVERDGRRLAKEKQVTVLTSRWVLTQKTSEIARCRIVVRDFATGGASALNSGIYAPTSSLDGLRCVLAVSAVVKDLSLLTADVSVAFMNAPVEAEACDLVLLPANMSINGCRVIAWLGKAMNGLRRAPLLWFLELQRVVYSMEVKTLLRIPYSGCRPPMECFWCLCTSTICLSLLKVNKKVTLSCSSCRIFGNKTHWKDSSAQEGRPTVFGENHL